MLKKIVYPSLNPCQRTEHSDDMKETRSTTGKLNFFYRFPDSLLLGPITATRLTMTVVMTLHRPLPLSRLKKQKQWSFLLPEQ